MELTFYILMLASYYNKFLIYIYLFLSYIYFLLCICTIIFLFLYINHIFYKKDKNNKCIIFHTQRRNQMNHTADNFSTRTVEFSDSYEPVAAPGQWCIALIEQGNGSSLCQDLIKDFQNRDCFLIHGSSPRITLSYSQGRPIRLFLLHFRLEEAESYDTADHSRQMLKQFFDPDTPFQHFSLPKKNYDTIRSYLKLLSQLQKDALPASPTIFYHTFLSFHLYFVQTGFILCPEKKQDGGRLSSRKIIIAQVKHLIRQNYADPLPLSYIADYVFTNPSYLSRIFKADTGISLSAYINQIRIDNAKLLLETTDELVIDIAVACGFNQIPHFNRIFKQFTGISPSEYRKKTRQPYS